MDGRGPFPTCASLNLAANLAVKPGAPGIIERQAQWSYNALSRQYWGDTPWP